MVWECISHHSTYDIGTLACHASAITREATTAMMYIATDSVLGDVQNLEILQRKDHDT